MERRTNAWPLSEVLLLVAGFVAALWGLSLVPASVERNVIRVGSASEGLSSLAWPSALEPVKEAGAYRAFFLGASETFGLPYTPDGQVSFANQLGAAYGAATGRKDLHIRAQANMGLSSVQIVAQAWRLLDEADPDLLVLVLGENELLDRVVAGSEWLPETVLGQVGAFVGAGRVLLDSMVVEQTGQGASVADFESMVRSARPGEPAMGGLPLGQRDRDYLMGELRARVRKLHGECEARGVGLALALTPRSLTTQAPWSSGATIGEVDKLFRRVFDEPKFEQLLEVEAWLERRPERADLHFAQALIWRAAGKDSQAKREFERVFELDQVAYHRTRQVTETLVALAAELDLPLVDLNDALVDEFGITKPELFLDYAHVNVAGHRRLAEWLAETWAGSVLPELPASGQRAFDQTLKFYPALLDPGSVERATGMSAVIVANYMLAFGNFRDALPLLEHAQSVLPKGHADGIVDRYLAFCRSQLER